MTMYMLSLAGGEQRTPDATHRASFGQATRVSVSRSPGVDTTGRDGTVGTVHGAVDRPATKDTAGAPNPGALAALLVRTLDIQDGAKVVLADFDSEELAAEVVAEIAALGREVTCNGQVASGARAQPLLAPA